MNRLLLGGHYDVDGVDDGDVEDGGHYDDYDHDYDHLRF